MLIHVHTNNQINVDIREGSRPSIKEQSIKCNDDISNMKESLVLRFNAPIPQQYTMHDTEVQSLQKFKATKGSTTRGWLHVK